MTRTIELSEALQRLPLETPAESAWTAVSAHLPKPPTRRAWPAALAAGVALLAVLLHFGTPAMPDPSQTAAVADDPVQQLMRRSAQLESAFYSQQDDAISSASVIAANMTLEEQLAAIDTQLVSQPAQGDMESLWRQRVELLDQGVRLNRNNAYYKASGQSYELTLASTN